MIAKALDKNISTTWMNTYLHINGSSTSETHGQLYLAP